MSLRYAFVFALLAVASGLFSVAVAGPTNGLSLVFLSPVVSFLMMAAAYGGGGPNLLGKRTDGGRHWWARLLFVPYLLLTRFSFLLNTLLVRHEPMCEVMPNLFLGRRLTATEAGRFTDAAVLDLAAEFSEARPFRKPDRYLSHPVLDATAPTAEQLGTAVLWITERLPQRPVFVHCALGHGRSASVVIAYLMHSGRVSSVRKGVRHVRRLRPGVRLSASQRKRLEEWQTARNHPTAA